MVTVLRLIGSAPGSGQDLCTCQESTMKKALRKRLASEMLGPSAAWPSEKRDVAMFQAAVKQLCPLWPSTLLVTPILDIPGTNDADSLNAQKVAEVLREDVDSIALLLDKNEKSGLEALYECGILQRLRASEEGGGGTSSARPPRVCLCFNMEKRTSNKPLTTVEVIRQLVVPSSSVESTRPREDREMEERGSDSDAENEESEKGKKGKDREGAESDSEDDDVSPTSAGNAKKNEETGQEKRRKAETMMRESFWEFWRGKDPSLSDAVFNKVIETGGVRFLSLYISAFRECMLNPEEVKDHLSARLTKRSSRKRNEEELDKLKKLTHVPNFLEFLEGNNPRWMESDVRRIQAAQRHAVPLCGESVSEKLFSQLSNREIGEVVISLKGLMKPTYPTDRLNEEFGSMTACKDFRGAWEKALMESWDLTEESRSTFDFGDALLAKFTEVVESVCGGRVMSSLCRQIETVVNDMHERKLLEQKSLNQLNFFRPAHNRLYAEMHERVFLKEQFRVETEMAHELRTQLGHWCEERYRERVPLWEEKLRVLMEALAGVLPKGRLRSENDRLVAVQKVLSEVFEEFVPAFVSRLQPDSLMPLDLEKEIFRPSRASAVKWAMTEIRNEVKEDESFIGGRKTLCEAILKGTEKINEGFVDRFSKYFKHYVFQESEFAEVLTGTKHRDRRSGVLCTVLSHLKVYDGPRRAVSLKNPFLPAPPRGRTQRKLFQVLEDIIFWIAEWLLEEIGKRPECEGEIPKLEELRREVERYRENMAIQGGTDPSVVVGKPFLALQRRNQSRALLAV